MISDVRAEILRLIKEGQWKRHIRLPKSSWLNIASSIALRNLKTKSVRTGKEMIDEVSRSILRPYIHSETSRTSRFGVCCMSVINPWALIVVAWITRNRGMSNVVGTIFMALLRERDSKR